jgi:hypothetical protein
MIHKRILIIQTAFIGDVVLSTPLVRNLRKIFPDSFLSFLLIPETKNVLENNPHLNQILVYDKRKKRGMGEFIRVLRADPTPVYAKRAFGPTVGNTWEDRLRQKHRFLFSHQQGGVSGGDS